MEKKLKFWIDYSSFKHVIYTYFSILLLGVIIAYFGMGIFKIYLLPYYYDIAGYVTLFLPYVNFIVFAFIIRSKSVDIYDIIDETFEPLKDLCNDIQKETEKLSTVKDLALEIKGEQKTPNIGSNNTSNSLSTIASRPLKKL
ncbi:hypothetical protein [Bacteroides sp.]